jgi:hypothetical protein
LRQELWDCLNKYPEAKHFIIAHSHGGNIAAISLEDAGLRHRVSGLACMSTPFLTARRRPFGSWFEGLFALGLFLVSVVSLIDPNEAVGWIALTGFIALMVARMTSLPDRLVKAITLGDLSGLNLLIVRSSADETTPLLALGQLVGWASTKLHAVVPHLVMLATFRDQSTRTRRLARAALVIGIPVAAFALFSVFQEPAKDLLSALAFPIAIIALLTNTNAMPSPEAAIIGVAVFMAVIAVFLVTFATGLSVILTSLAVGWVGALCGLVVEVAPEAAPPGQWLIQQIPVSTAKPMSFLALQHSVTYGDPRAIDSIGRWILTSARHPSLLPDEQDAVSASQ